MSAAGGTIVSTAAPNGQYPAGEGGEHGIVQITQTENWNAKTAKKNVTRYTVYTTPPSPTKTF